MALASASASALLLVGHGTLTDPADAPEFLRRIRGGRPAPAELIAEIQRRYRQIGASPLLEITRSLGRAIRGRLDIPVHVAMRFWSPLVAEVLREVTAQGVRELCILPVAPFSVHVYADVVSEALASLEGEGTATIALRPVAAYGADPGLVAAHAARIAPWLADRNPAHTGLVLSAHSLPHRALAAGDGYQTEFEACAALVGRELGWPIRIAYQSQGTGGGPWLGPTLREAFAAARREGKGTVVVAPVGFLADHVETLFDLDVEARAHAAAEGLDFHRVPALNDDPLLVEALSAIASRTLRGAT